MREELSHTIESTGVCDAITNLGPKVASSLSFSTSQKPRSGVNHVTPEVHSLEMKEQKWVWASFKSSSSVSQRGLFLFMNSSDSHTHFDKTIHAASLRLLFSWVRCQNWMLPRQNVLFLNSAAVPDPIERVQVLLPGSRLTNTFTTSIWLLQFTHICINHANNLKTLLLAKNVNFLSVAFH